MTTADVTLARPDVTLPGVIALPADVASPVPGVVIAHEILGFTPHIRSLTQRFAHAGVAALAVNLFAREGTPPPEGAPLEDVQAFAWSLPDDRVVADLCAAGDWLRARPEVRDDHVVLVGFSYGGTMALHVAAHDSPFRAVIAFYPKTLYPRTSAERVTSPIHRVPAMRVPVHAHFGEADGAIPMEEVASFREAIQAHDPRSEVYVYAGARHGFFNDSRPRSYHPASATLAWNRVLACATLELC